MESTLDKTPKRQDMIGTLKLRDHLFRCINEQLDMILLYEEALKISPTFNTEMLLQRQQLQCREILHRLEAMEKELHQAEITIDR